MTMTQHPQAQQSQTQQSMPLALRSTASSGAGGPAAAQKQPGQAGPFARIRGSFTKFRAARPVLSKRLGQLSLVLAAVLLLFLCALSVIPTVTKGNIVAVISGSMEPALAQGDLVINRGVAADSACDALNPGDVLTYLRSGDGLITHRITGIAEGEYNDNTTCRILTQGDANTQPDTPVSPAQVRGVMAYSLHGFGWLWQTLSPIGMFLLILVFAVVFFVCGWALVHRSAEIQWIDPVRARQLAEASVAAQTKRESAKRRRKAATPKQKTERATRTSAPKPVRGAVAPDAARSTSGAPSQPVQGPTMPVNVVEEVPEPPVTLAPVMPAPVAAVAAVSAVSASAAQAPVVPAPVSEAPVVPAPVAEAPVIPVAEAPVVPAPVAEAPVIPASVTEAPVIPAPVAETPVESETSVPVAVAPALPVPEAAVIPVAAAPVIPVAEAPAAPATEALAATPPVSAESVFDPQIRQQRSLIAERERVVSDREQNLALREEQVEDIEVVLQREQTRIEEAQRANEAELRRARAEFSERLEAAKHEFNGQRMHMLETLEDRASELTQLEQQFNERQQRREQELQAWQDRLLAEHQRLRDEETTLRDRMEAASKTPSVAAPVLSAQATESPSPLSSFELLAEVPAETPAPIIDEEPEPLSQAEIEFNNRIEALMRSMKDLSAATENL